MDIQSHTTQPQILDDGWGWIKLLVNGKEEQFGGVPKYPRGDVVILPYDQKNKKQRVVPWNWHWGKDTVGPMDHKPGVRRVDLDHFLPENEPAPDVVILTQGRGDGNNSGPGELGVDDALKEYLEKKGISEVYILKTAQAIEKYKEITSAHPEKKVAAFMHLTC